MARQSETDKAVNALFEEIYFVPTPEMRRIKSRLIVALEDNPIASIQDLTCAAAVQLTREAKLQKWWGTPGFKAWFTNTDEFREYLETCKLDMLSLLKDLALDPELREGSRIQAAKIVLDVAIRTENQKKEAQYADAQIQKMNEEQLKRYIEKQMKLLGESDE